MQLSKNNHTFHDPTPKNPNLNSYISNPRLSILQMRSEANIPWDYNTVDFIWKSEFKIEFSKLEES